VGYVSAVRGLGSQRWPAQACCCCPPRMLLLLTQHCYKVGAGDNSDVPLLQGKQG
jgi:DUF1680 family protein